MRDQFARLLLPVCLALLPTCLWSENLTVRMWDLKPLPEGGFTASGLEVPPPDMSLPLVQDDGKDPALRLLRSLGARGIANGFQGILYDNRDRKHSLLAPELFPRLRHIAYGSEMRLKSSDYGLAGMILYPAVVFGNSSTAVTAGLYKRSLTRMAMTSPSGAAASARLYLNNHIYVYPEHRDYDHIDRYPAHWPYHVVSQGSSGSDQPFLKAIAATLAAFPPDTLAALKERGLVAPTLQYILRRNLTSVQSREDYFGFVPQRPVLTKEELRPVRMVSHAASLRPEYVLPLVRLRVVEEGFQRAAGLAQRDEVLFDTPAAVARIWRGFEGRREMVVSVEDTEVPMGMPVSYSWHLLQGDPERVTITPQSPHGRTARVTVDWHDPFDIPRGLNAKSGTRRTSRVDIAVFADNGRELSAPSIVSIAFPAHQTRVYFRDPDGELRLESIDYRAGDTEEVADPVLYWSADWTDHAIYDDGGRLSGWRRVYADEARGEAVVPLFANAEDYQLIERGGGVVLEQVK
ncbi:hypothetical protein [Antarctobacter jejuensis]|uniref:hypothetical protein n=1 Tax=Antarctobacter jejuensis TaxID=1439938 RepID=UPI003FD458C4